MTSRRRSAIRMVKDTSQNQKKQKLKLFTRTFRSRLHRGTEEEGEPRRSFDENQLQTITKEARRDPSTIAETLKLCY